MGKLIYSMITSLDGYVSDRDGQFGWGVPEEEPHQFVNEQSRGIGTYLYGRRMYETMIYWETVDTPDQPPYVREYARIWQSTRKIVYSRTLTEVSSERTRIERTFDPVRKLKAESGLDITVDGPNLAAQAIQAGLVDEYQLYIGPAIVGGGQRFLPDNVHTNLTLLDEHRFTNGVLYLRYAVNQ
jgi:dihydrofolate reductase